MVKGQPKYSLTSMASIALAIWLTVGYAVPHGLWNDYGFANLTELALVSLPARYCYGVAVVFSAIVLMAFAPDEVRAVFRRNNDRPIMTWRFFLWLLTCLYIGLLVLSPVIYNSDPNTTQRATVLMIAVATGLLAALVCERSRYALVLIAGLCVYQALFVVYNACARQNGLLSGSVYRAGGSFAHPEGVCMEMLLGVPLALCFAMSSRGRLPKIVGYVLTGILLAALMFTWYRSGIIACVVSILLQLRHTLNGRAWTVALIVGVLSIVLTFGVRSMGVANSQSTARSNAGHVALWRDGWARFEGRWAKGAGLGKGQYSDATASTYTDAGCTALEWLDEFGVLGGFLYAGMAVCIAGALRARRTSLTVAIVASWTGLMIAGMFDTVFGTPDRASITVLISILLGATLLAASEVPIRCSARASCETGTLEWT